MTDSYLRARPQGSCADPVAVDDAGTRHLVPCSLPEGHGGDCAPSSRWRRNHDCRACRCETA